MTEARPAPRPATTSSSPAVDATIELSDGRRLAYSEWGDRSGHPVFLFHGTPGSRLLCPDVDATAAAGVRLITVDRPGWGRSDPRPWHTLGDFSLDVAELLEALGADRAGVIGWSGGGPFALAFGYAAPDRVSAVGVAGSSSHVESMPPEELPPELGELIERLRRSDPAAYEEVLARGQAFVDDPRVILDMTLAATDDPDRDLMAAREPAFAAYWTEAASGGPDGFASSWVATFGLPWGFSPEELKVPVHIWHGESDQVVPLRHSERLAALIPGSELTVYPSEGHLCPVSHWAEMLEQVVGVSGSGDACSE